MFSFQRIRNQVSARLAIIGRVDEAMMHDLYSKAISEELAEARKSADKLTRVAEDTVRAQHPERKWVMVDVTEWSKVRDAVVSLRKSLDVGV